MRPALKQAVEYGLRQRRALGGIGARAEFVEQDERMSVRGLHAAPRCRICAVNVDR